MKKAKILYWVFSGLFGALMLLSAIPDVMMDQEAVEGFKRIGLTSALVPFVGWAKVLGVLTILTPGHRLLKEWAYAGLFIDLAGATYLFIMAGLPASTCFFMAIPITLGIAAYLSYRNIVRIQNPDARQ